jgi:hypothetical protein
MDVGLRQRALLLRVASGVRMIQRFSLDMWHLRDVPVAANVMVRRPFW